MVLWYLSNSEDDMVFITDSARVHEFMPCEFVALCAVTKLHQGTLTLLLKGQKELFVLPKPTWHRFIFFTGVYASNIESTDPDLVVGRKLSREVKFFYHHTCLVATTLEGVVKEGFKRYDIELVSDWFIRSIEYRMEFWADSPDFDRVPPPCKKFEFEVADF